MLWNCGAIKTLESPLDCKEIKLVNPRGNQPSIFIGRTNADVEALVLWPYDAKSWLIGKDPDTGKYWRQKEQGKAEDETVRWQHQLYRHEFEQTQETVEDRGSSVLQSVRSQEVGHDWATEQQQALHCLYSCISVSVKAQFIKWMGGKEELDDRNGLCDR